MSCASALLFCLDESVENMITDDCFISVNVTNDTQTLPDRLDAILNLTGMKTRLRNTLTVSGSYFIKITSFSQLFYGVCVLKYFPLNFQSIELHFCSLQPRFHSCHKLNMALP